MRSKRQKKQGQSMLEFVAVILFILAAFIVFQKYIVRGMTGRWKGVGDTFGEGRIYDPHKTTECATQVFFYGQNAVWYNQECFEANCKGACLEAARTLAACRNCLENTCHSNYCDDQP